MMSLTGISTFSSAASTPTTVPTAHLDVDSRPIENRLNKLAIELKAAGWQGSEDECDTIGPKRRPTALIFRNITIPSDDFDKIQEIFKEIRGSAENRLQPVVEPISEDRYDRCLIDLRSHLLDLQNPFLVRSISEKFKNTGDGVVDFRNLETLTSQCIDASWPIETKTSLLKFLTIFRNEALRNSDLVDTFKNNLSKISGELLEKAEQEIKGYWPDFITLFSIPSFGRLDNNNYKKIVRIINESIPDDLRDFTDEMARDKIINLDEIEEFLRRIGYGHNFRTLLSEVINQKPSAKLGILAFWNDSDDSFRGNTLNFTSPDGKGDVFGQIEKCVTRANGDKVFYLANRSELHVRNKIFCITVVEYRRYNNFLNSLIDIFNQGDKISITSQTDQNLPNTIASGDYVYGSRDYHNPYLKSPFYEITFSDPLTSQNSCRIKISMDNQGNPKYLKVEKWNDSQFSRGSWSGLDEFERRHKVSEVVTTQIGGINKTNIERFLYIKKEKDENQIKKEYNQKIKEEKDKLIESLKAAENEVLLNKLLESYISYGMKSIDIKLLNENHLNILKTISRLFHDHLQIDRTAEHTLIEAILQANYAKQIQVKDSILVETTMGLLESAQKHVDKIRGSHMNSTLFVGNSGSGKSATVSYLMGAKLTRFRNQLNQKALKLEDEADISKYPKIGQSIGSSETIYAQGYEVDGRPCLLIDCPGFGDTRGDGVELCTHFSIDQVVAAAQKLSAIAIVIPVSAFGEKGNQVIDLIRSVQKRFPDTFNPRDLESNRRVYLLLTKQSVSGDLATGLRNNGFENFVLEAREELSKLDSQSMQAAAIRERLDLWTVIKYMSQNKQIYFIDSENDAGREQLLNIFADREYYLNKTQYQSAMSSSNMHGKFGEIAQLAAFAWKDHIISTYLHALPEEIEKSTAELKHSQECLENLKKEKDARQKRAKDLEERIKFCQDFLEQLKLKPAQVSGNEMIENPDQIKAIGDTSKQDEEDAKNTLPTKSPAVGNVDLKQVKNNATTAYTRELENEKNHILEIERVLKRKNDELDRLNNEIKARSNMIENNSKKIKEYELKISELEVGDQDVDLGGFERRKPEERIVLHKVAEQIFKEAHKNVEKVDQTKALQGVTYDGLCQEYKGTTIHQVFIEKKFRLSPANEKERASFLVSHKGGEYEATVTGNRYEIMDEKTASTDGKKISYLYRLEWIGNSDLPWIKISHKIPKREYNYADIQEKHSEIDVLKQQISSAMLYLNGDNEIRGAIKETKDLEEEIKSKTQEKTTSEKNISDLTNLCKLEQMQTMLADPEKRSQKPDHESANVDRSTAGEVNVGYSKQELIQTALDRTENRSQEPERQQGDPNSSTAGKGETELSLQEKIQKMIERNEKMLKETEIEKMENENCNEIDGKITQAGKEIEIKQASLEKLKLKRRYLALLITTEWGKAIQLRKFADLVVGNSGKEYKNETIQRCNEFIQLFDTQKDSLLVSIQEEHKFLKTA